MANFAIFVSGLAAGIFGTIAVAVILFLYMMTRPRRG